MEFTIDIGLLIRSAVIIASAFLVIYLSNRFFARVIAATPRLHLKFLRSVVNFVVILLAVYSFAAQFEFTKDLSKTLLQSGTLIIAVATFAAQQALGNVISGFSISAARPCEVGQWVRLISGSDLIAEGLVKDMTIRHVSIEQANGQICVIPNSVVDAAVILNMNFSNSISIEVGYDTDVERAIKIIRDICAGEALYRGNNPQELAVSVSSLTANGMLLKFLVKADTMDDCYTLCSNIRKKMVKAFREEGIDIPYQTVTLDMPESHQTEEEHTK